MKRIIIALILASIFITACNQTSENTNSTTSTTISEKQTTTTVENQKVPITTSTTIPQSPKTPGSTNECNSDSDCMTSGCSGTICQAKSAPRMFSTCEYKEEYACYKTIICGCLNDKCEWKKTAAFDKCIESAKNLGGIPIV